ncbi:MAG: diguanylate cyclase [Dehalococcoidia bacterium]|nr:diguanylate cyclase [Dehalococcoidia bacterium]
MVKAKARLPRAGRGLPGLKVPVPAILLRLPGLGSEVIPARLLVPIMLIVLLAAAAVMNVIDGEDTTQLAWALLLLIAVASFVRVLPASEAIAAVLSVAVYDGILLMRTIGGSNHSPAIIAGMACFIMVAWVSRTASQRLSLDEDEMLRKSILLEEGATRDSITGVVKEQHARKLLTEETLLSRRYALHLALLMVGIDDWEATVSERGPQKATDLLVRLGDILTKSVRTGIDTVSRYHGSGFMVIMPDTALKGARALAEQICQKALEEVDLVARVGIAEFPADASTPEDLITEAEEAMEFARAAELRIADRKLLT